MSAWLSFSSGVIIQCTGLPVWSWTMFCWQLCEIFRRLVGWLCSCPAAQWGHRNFTLYCQQNIVPDNTGHPVEGWSYFSQKNIGSGASEIWDAIQLTKMLTRVLTRILTRVLTRTAHAKVVCVKNCSLYWDHTGGLFKKGSRMRTRVKTRVSNFVNWIATQKSGIWYPKITSHLCVLMKDTTTNYADIMLLIKRFCPGSQKKLSGLYIYSLQVLVLVTRFREYEINETEWMVPRKNFVQFAFWHSCVIV